MTSRKKLAAFLDRVARGQVTSIAPAQTSVLDQMIAEQAGLSAIVSLAVEELQGLGDHEMAARLIARAATAAAAADTAAARRDAADRPLFRAAVLIGSLGVILDDLVRELRGGGAR